MCFYIGTAQLKQTWVGLKPNLQGGTGFNLLRVHFWTPVQRKTEFDDLLEALGLYKDISTEYGLNQTVHHQWRFGDPHKKSGEPVRHDYEIKVVNGVEVAPGPTVRGPYCQLDVGLCDVDVFLHWNSAAEEGAWVGLKPDLQGGTGFNLLRVHFWTPVQRNVFQKGVRKWPA